MGKLEMHKARREHFVASGPYPHEGGCNGCQESNACNCCGMPIECQRGEVGSDHCTNGRCMACHNAVCTDGGATYPGHGFGTRADAYARAEKHQRNVADRSEASGQ